MDVQVENGVLVPGLSFSFRKRYSPVDWKRIASVDIERIVQELDFKCLQENIINIAFCNIQLEGVQGVSHNFLKLFQLAQLTIEYLLHCQQYLSMQKQLLKQRADQLEIKVSEGKDCFDKLSQQLNCVKKENKKRKKIIHAYQLMLKSGSTGIYPCPKCQRQFITVDYLRSHLQRRHPSQKEFTDTPDGVMKFDMVQQVEKKLREDIDSRFQKSELQLRQEIQEIQQNGVESFQRCSEEFKSWKAVEQDKMKMELKDLKVSLMSELTSFENQNLQLDQDSEELSRSSHREEWINFGDCSHPLEHKKPLFQESNKVAEEWEELSGSEKDEPDVFELHENIHPNETLARTSKFSHSKDFLRKIKDETEMILVNGLHQRGIIKGISRLSDGDLQSKLHFLNEERRRRFLARKQCCDLVKVRKHYSTVVDCKSSVDDGNSGSFK